MFALARQGEQWNTLARLPESTWDSPNPPVTEKLLSRVSCLIREVKSHVRS